MITAFKKKLNSLGVEENKDILLGLSGGLDSVALFHLLIEAAIPFRAAHVNYALRAEEADLDEAFVRELCEEYKIPLDVLKVAEEHWNDQNIQDEARKIRYDFFRSLSPDLILVAHHQDDLVETVLMNIVRGSGIRGLQGIKEKNGKIIRPMLDHSKDELQEYLTSKDKLWREDQSNTSSKYKRNRFRNEIIPMLKEENPSLNAAIERLRSNSMQVIMDLERSFGEFKKSMVSQLDGEIRIAKGRPDLLDKHLYDQIHEFGFSSDQARSIIRSLANIGAEFHSRTHTLYVDRKDLIIVAHEAENNDPPLEIFENTSAMLEPLRMMLKTSDDTKVRVEEGLFQFDKDKLSFPLILRPWREGDRMQPLGMTGKKKISDILIDKKVSRSDKKKLRVIESAGEIVWLSLGVISEKVKLNHSTKKSWEIHLG